MILFCNNSNMWHTHAHTQTATDVCLIGVISWRTLKQRRPLWLRLQFSCDYVKLWRRLCSFLKSCKATYSLCVYLITLWACMCVLKEVWITELSHKLWERTFCTPPTLCQRAITFHWLPGASSDATSLSLLCRYLYLPAPMAAQLCIYLLCLLVAAGKMMQ